MNDIDKGAVGDNELSYIMGRVDAKLDMALDRIAVLEKAIASSEAEKIDRRDDRADKILMGLTTKQHGVLQMLLNARSNAEIAERLGVAESTAKVHVRLIARKCGLIKRQQVTGFLKPAFDSMPEAQYVTFSRGLPKNWDTEWGNGSEKFDNILKG